MSQSIYYLSNRYLSNFCVWQHKEKKKSTSVKDWDHGLMITGLDLYDRDPSMKKVIGKLVKFRKRNYID